MISSNSAVILGIVSLYFLSNVQAQITKEDLPPQLHYVLESDLETWEPLPELSKMFSYYQSGFDSENRPIWVVEVGKWDVRTILERGDKWETLFDKYMDKWLWRLMDSTKTKATEDFPVTEVILIIDCDGMDYRQLNSPKAVGYALKKLRTLAYALPLAHGMYIVNANFVAKHAINLVRPIIGKDFHRVDIFGTNPNSYRPFLLKRLPKDQLPEWYGGDKDFTPVKVFG